MARVVLPEHSSAIDERCVTDEALMVRLSRRDEEALACLYDRHAAAAYALALRIAWNREMAEEAVQDAFLEVWRAADRFHPARGSVRGWLLAIVRHRAIDLVRGPQRRAGQMMSIDLSGGPSLAASDDPAGDAFRTIEAEDIRFVLDSLPPEQRTVVDLAYFGGLSHTEVAAYLGVPLGTVKSRMRLAMQRLRAMLRDRSPQRGGEDGRP